MNIGALKKVELREIWPREDADFTNWLNDNLDILGETLGLGLEVSETECSWDNSDFRADIRATTKEGKIVIIENQLEKTDHKHLGQIMTYMINMESKIAIWLAKKAREEHVNVINWLNESTDKDFYLIQVESYQIDNSNPAPFFKVVCRPSIEMKKIGQQKKEQSEAGKLKEDFWKSFLEKAIKKTDFFANDKPHSWTARINEMGATGVALGCWINKDKTAVSILFDPDLTGKFLNLKEKLESEIGFSLEKKAKGRGMAKRKKPCFVRWFDRSGYRSPRDEWDQIQEEMIERFVKLENAIKPFLKQLKTSHKAA